MRLKNKGLMIILMGVVMSIIFIQVGNTATTEDKINRLNGALTLLTRQEIGTAVRKCGLEENLILAIIKVESDFSNGAFNKKSNDYGLMQVNEYHVLNSRLDRNRLLWDISYNVAQGCKVLSYFLTRYKVKREAIARYNCGTRKKCIKLRSVKRYVKKVRFWYRRLESKKTISYHMDKGLLRQIKKTLRTREH